MDAINSPFRYPGGKFYARRLILEHLLPHECYVEPFAGGGSIFFAKPKAARNCLNDIDAELINVYLHIRDEPEGLIDFLKGLPATKELHRYYKDEFIPTTALEQAGRWYYLNRTSYSGIMKRQNCYWGYGDKYSMRPENWGRNILRTSQKLQGVELTSLDFEAVIEASPDGAFLFIDPPYFEADQDKFYECSFSREDHYRLAKILQIHSPRLHFLITYDNSPQVRELYHWAYDMLEREWNYTINRTDDQRKGGKKDEKGARYKGREIFIVNFQSTAHTVAQIPLFGG
jgi:DNA adenine methylase